MDNKFHKSVNHLFYFRGKIIFNVGFLINQEILISKILIFQVPERLYQLVDRSTDGLVTADQVMEFIAGLQSIRYDKCC